jgi:hypothetical protein
MAWTMDVRDFEDLIDRLGDDMSRWPEDQRLAAEGLLASSCEAQALLEEARMLRQALAGSPIRAPAGLVDRILSAASKLNIEPPRTEDGEAAHPAGATQSG